MAKEKDTPKLSYKDIADYILGNQATKDFEAIGPREKFLQKLEDTKRGQEAKLQKKKAAAKEGDAPDLEQPKKKEREEKSPEQAYEAKVHSKSNDIRAKFASHKDDPKFRAYVLELCQDDKLKDILYPGWKKEERAAPAFPDEEEILRQFNIKEDKHHYFNTDGARKEAQEQYVRSFLLAKFVDDCIERPGHQQEDSMAHEMAYKMTIFWRGNLDEVNKYLERTNYYATNQALHDSLASTDIAADGTQVTLDVWRHLILSTKDAKAVLDNFGNADRIQEKLGKAPANISEIQETAMKLQYARAQEKPEMAVIFGKYKVSEEIFNRCLEIDACKKKKDNLPDVSINGADLDHPGYHLVKLPVDDPRAYILGKITSCCQSIGDNSERCVIDGVTRENNGFYVLLKGKEGANPLFEDGKINYRDFDIVGQGYAWRTRAGNICFDSWENDGMDGDSKRKKSDEVICHLLPAYARAVEEMGIDRVLIGCGGKTPQAYKSKGRAESSELMLEGYAYGDASIQAEIGTSSRLLSAREELLPLTQGKSVDQFVSVKSIESFRDLPKELIEQLLSNPSYKLLTGPLMFPATDANKFYEDILKDRKKMQVLTSDDATRAYQTGAVKASDLIGLDLDKIQILISGAAIKAYKTGAVTASDLKDLGLDKIQALTSPDAIYAYEIKAVTASDLKDLGLDKIQVLISDDVILAYETEAVKASDLIRLDSDKIQILISGAAIKAYKTGAVTASDLKDLGLDKIQALTSGAAIEAYSTKKVKFSDLISETVTGIHINILQKISQHYCNESVRIPGEIDSNKIQALTSYYAIKAYRRKAVKASDLIGLDLDKIEALTLPDALRAYETKAVTVSDLIALDIDIIKALTSDAAIRAYETKTVTVSDLIALDIDIIKALTSPGAIEAYKTEAVTASDLRVLDLDKIEALTSYAVIEAYSTKKVKFSDLISETVTGIHINILQKIAEHYCQEEITIPEGIDSNKIQALTSYDALRAYETRAVTVSDLMHLDPKKIEALTSWYARKAYETKAVKPRDLIRLDSDKIEALTSHTAISAYETKAVTVSDLMHLDPKKIEALTSWYALRAYETKAVNVSDLKDLGLDKIQALTSPAAIRAYETKAVTVSDLKDLGLDKIQALTSPAAIRAYKTEAVKPRDLIDLDSKAIEALTSPAAIRAYKTEAVKPRDLIDLDSKAIEALTSPAAIRAYEPEAVKPRDLIDLDSKAIEALTSPAAIRAYKTEAVNVSDLKDLGLDKIQALTSPAAIRAYETKAVNVSDLKDLGLDKIEALTSDATIRAYETKAVTVSDLIRLDSDKIEALTSYAAIRAYETEKVKASDLLSETVTGIHIKILQKIAEHYCQEDITIPEQIDSNKIQALTSYAAIRAYETRAVKVSDLIGLDLDKIQALTSPNAASAYKIKAVKASDLIALNIDIIKALTSPNAARAYETEKVKASDLLSDTEREIHIKILQTISQYYCGEAVIISEQIDSNKIEALTSPDAIRAYETKAVKVSDLIGLDQNKIRALTSYSAVNTYRSKVVEPQQLMHLASDKICEFFREIRYLQESRKEIDVQQILASPKFSQSTEDRQAATFAERLNRGGDLEGPSRGTP